MYTGQDLDNVGQAYRQVLPQGGRGILWRACGYMLLFSTTALVGLLLGVAWVIWEAS
jgi:hypothetical protein